MCLTINTDVHTKRTWNRTFSRRIPKPLVADKDILCVKTLLPIPFSRNCKFMTPYRNMEVKFDWLNGVAELVSDVKSKRLPFSVFKSVVKPKNFNVENGIHSWVNGTICHRMGTQFNAIIPKGAKYYIGEDGDLVSSRLLVFENENFYNDYLSKNKE